MKLIPPAAPDKEHVRALDRGLSILSLLRDRGEQSLTEISVALQLDKATVLRLLNTMGAQGFSELNLATRRYRLGLACVTYGRRAASDCALRREAVCQLELLQQASGQMATLGTLYRRQVLVLDKLYGHLQERVRSLWGAHLLHLHSTGMGKAMLACLPAAEVLVVAAEHGLPRQTPRTLTTLPDLLADLEQTRQRGFAVDHEENLEGLCCLAMAIFGAGDEVLGAFSVSYPASAFNATAYQPAVPALRQACLEVSRALGASEKALIHLAGWQTFSNPEVTYANYQ